jgi:uncharacterized protein (DUF362 family)
MAELLAKIAGSMSQFVKPGDRVLVKPNMLDTVKEDYSVTTHP